MYSIATERVSVMYLPQVYQDAQFSFLFGQVEFSLELGLQF